MFGQPTLVARHVGGDAQREALLAEQGVAAVAGTVGPDFAGFRVVHDVLDGRVARPGHILLAGFQRGADGMHAGDEFAIGAEHVKYLGAHAGHGTHVDHDIGRIGNFHADVSDRRTERTHRERDDVHRAALHAALEQAVQGFAHLGRFFPVIGRAGVFLLLGADVGAVFDAGNVGRIGESQVGVRAFLLVELDQGAGFNHFRAQAVVFFLRTIRPIDLVRLGQRCDFSDPLLEAFVFDVIGDVQCDGHGVSLSG